MPNGPHLDLTTRYDVNGQGLITKEVVDPSEDWLNASRGSGHLNLVTVHTHNGAGPRTSTTIDPPDATKPGDELDIVWQWTYDAAGRVEEVAGPQGTVAYPHDEMGRVLTETRPGSRTVTSTYLVEGRLDRQADWESGWTAFTYDPGGRLLTETRDTGIVTSYTYDDAGRLDTIQAMDGATLLAGYDYALDANGNRTEVVTAGGAGPGRGAGAGARRAAGAAAADRAGAAGGRLPPGAPESGARATIAA